MKREIIHFTNVAENDKEAMVVEDFDVFSFIFFEDVFEIDFDEYRYQILKSFVGSRAILS